MIDDTRDRQSVYRRPIRRRGFDTFQAWTGKEEEAPRKTGLQNIKQFKAKFVSNNHRYISINLATPNVRRWHFK